MKLEVTLVAISIVFAANTVLAGDPLEERATGMDLADTGEVLHVAHLFVEAKRSGPAKRYYKIAMQRMRNKAEARLGLALAGNIDSSLHQSKASCRKLKAAFSNSNVPDICFGKVWLKFGRSSRALEVFEKLKNKTEDSRILNGLAKSHALMNRYDEAITLYKDSLKLDDNYKTRLGLGLALEMKGNSEEARKELEKAVEMEPFSVLAAFNLGRVMARGEKAAAHIGRALEIRPRWPKALLTIGNIYLANGKWERAADAFRRGIELEPQRGALHLGLGRVLYKKKKYKEARATLEKALELVPNFADATMMLADVELALGNSFKAADLAERAASLSADSPELFVDIARMFKEMKRYTRANAYFEKAVSLKPGMTRPLVSLGDIACKRRMYDKGIDYYKRALKGDLKGFSETDIKERIKECH